MRRGRRDPDPRVPHVPDERLDEQLRLWLEEHIVQAPRGLGPEGGEQLELCELPPREGRRWVPHPVDEWGAGRG